MDNLLKMMEIKDEKFNYFFKAEKVAETLGVSQNSVYASREKSKSQKKKIAKAEKNNEAYVTDKLDKLYAFSIVKERLESVNNNAIQGSKDSIVLALDGMMQSDKKYKITVEQV